MVLIAAGEAAGGGGASTLGGGMRELCFRVGAETASGARRSWPCRGSNAVVATSFVSWRSAATSIVPRELRVFDRGFVCRLSEAEGAMADGMLVMVRWDALEAAAMRLSEVVAGRTTAVTVGALHHGSSVQWPDDVGRCASGRRRICVASWWESPGGREFLSPADGCRDPRKPRSVPPAPSCRRDGETILGVGLGRLVDVGPKGTKNCGVQLQESRLDRLYVCSLPWVLLRLRAGAHVLRDASSLQAQGARLPQRFRELRRSSTGCRS